jgi:hypothetical protein
MSRRHEHVAWDVIGLDTYERILLLAYARHACEHCGLCWPGTVRLELRTGIRKTAQAAVRARLVERGLLKIHAYPNGGRGMSTEMVVLPRDIELSTAPCGKCVDNLKTNRRAVGIETETDR